MRVREWKRQIEIDDQLSTGRQSTAKRDGKTEPAINREVEKIEDEKQSERVS